MIVSILADRPHYKAGGNNPYLSHTSWPLWIGAGPAPWNLGATRKAYRHAGALPWEMVREASTVTGQWTLNGLNFLTFTTGILSPPSPGAYYVAEKVGTAANSSRGTLVELIWPINPGVPPLNITGGSNSNWGPMGGSDPFLYTGDILLAAEFVYPGHPELGVTQDNGPSVEVSIGDAKEIALVRAPIYDVSARRLGTQVQYMFKITGIGYTYSDLASLPTFTPPPASREHSLYPFTSRSVADDGEDSLCSKVPGPMGGSRYMMAAHISNGYTYCATIDQPTGLVTGIVSVPEPNVVQASVLDQWGLSGFEPRACAMTWGGMRKIIAQVDPCGNRPRNMTSNMPQGITKLFIFNQGRNYTTATITITPPYAGAPASEVARADAVIVDGKIVDTIITNPGSGYSSTPLVTVTGDGTLADIEAVVLSSGSLFWRLAQPWKAVLHLRQRAWDSGQPPLDDWQDLTWKSGVARNPAIFVNPNTGPGGYGEFRLFRGLRARDSKELSVAGWNNLCTFTGGIGYQTQADGVIATPPPIGADILISGASGMTYWVPGSPPSFPPAYYPINFVLFPDGAPVSFTMPVAMGGVL